MLGQNAIPAMYTLAYSSTLQLRLTVTTDSGQPVNPGSKHLLADDSYLTEIESDANQATQISFQRVHHKQQKSAPLL